MWDLAKLRASRALWRAREIKAFQLWQSRRKRLPQHDQRRRDAFAAYVKARDERRRRDRQIDAASAVHGASAPGLALIKEFEGFRSAPYRDAVGVWTIGYGETKGVGPNTKPISEAEASALLERRVNRDYLAPVLALAKAIGWHIRQNEADALASLVYNLGPGILSQGRTMGDAIRTKAPARIADAFLVYDKAGSPPRPLAGLTLRRKRERALFLK